MEHTLSQKKTILVVDDERYILKVLEARLTLAGFMILTADSVKKAIEIFNKRQLDLVISDMRMPEMGGMDLLKKVQSIRPGFPVILMTAYGTIPDSVSAIKAGAAEYLTKPFNDIELLKKVRKILRTESHLTTQGKTSPLNNVLLCDASVSMKELCELIEQIIPSDVNVLIMGESGVGKELVARLIHEQGPRKNHPMVVVDCGSTPNGLLESELFGHVRGAFTHAVRDKKGLIQAAEGGTLFLDEIGNISADMQARLLRFLENRKIRKIGGLKEIPVDCRIISATNLDLTEEVQAGRFREDLYYRLWAVILRVPPLRERKKDIPFLAHQFVEQFSKNKGCPLKKLDPKTIEWLCDLTWPGNVRELKNAIEGAVTLCKNDIIHPSDIKLAGVAEISRPSISQNDSLSLKENELKLILRALDEADWVQKDAAPLLGISRRALHYKIKKIGIHPAMKRSGG